MARVRKGDAAAFQVLLKRYEQRVRGRLLQLVKDEATASDLLQEVFLRIWTKAPNNGKAGVRWQAGSSGLCGARLTRIDCLSPVVLGQRYGIAASERAPSCVKYEVTGSDLERELVLAEGVDIA